MKTRDFLRKKASVMGMRVYRALRGIVRAVTHDMETVWRVEKPDEPCVFVCNHAGMMGPIAMCARFPLADGCRPWFNAQVLSPREMPAYVRQDYWWKPGSFFAPLCNVTLPYLAAAVLPPIMRNVPGIPVYHDNRVALTMKKSLKALQSGSHLIIFPEQPSGFGGHHDWINTGFLNVAPLYHRLTGKALSFFPVHIDCAAHTMTVSPPVRFDPVRTLAEQTQTIADALAAGLRGMPRD